MFAKWIPTDARFSFSIEDNGGVEITRDRHRLLTQAGRPIVRDDNGFPVLASSTPTPDQIAAQYELALDEFLDDVARRYRYADRTRLALRAGYPNGHQALAAAFGTWMDTCNDLAKQLYIDVESGAVQMPSLKEFMAIFPAFNSPL